MAWDRDREVLFNGIFWRGSVCVEIFYLHPSRLEAVSVGAPGLVTQLDHTLNWPRGIKGVESIFDGLSVDLSALKKVEEIQLIIGGDDVQKVGGGFVEWFHGREEMKKEIKDLISSLPNRKDALLKLKETFNSAGITVEFEIIDGVAHNSARAAVKVIEFLEPRLTRWHVK